MGCRKNQQLQAAYERKLEHAQETQLKVQGVVDKAEELLPMLERLQDLWNHVPANFRDYVYFTWARVSQNSSGHSHSPPNPSTERTQAALFRFINDVKLYRRHLASISGSDELLSPPTSPPNEVAYP